MKTQYKSVAKRISRLFLQLLIALLIFLPMSRVVAALIEMRTLDYGFQDPSEAILFLSSRNDLWSLYVMQPDDPTVRLFVESDFEEGGEIGFSDVSPDGRILAFTSFKTREGSDYPSDEILLLDLETGLISPLTSDGEDNWNPQWSPDGTQIAFFQGQYPDVYIADLITGETNLLISNGIIANSTGSPIGGLITGLTWSPDGDQIVVSIAVGHGDYETLFSISLDGSNLRRLISNEQRNTEPVWSANSNIIYFVCGWGEICRIDLTTSQIQQLTDLEHSIGGQYVIGTFDVSNTDRVVFSVIDFDRGTDDIYLLETSGQEVINLTANSGVTNAAPRWIYLNSIPPTPPVDDVLDGG